MNPTRDLRTALIIALALVALTLKLAIAYNTIGTNDAVLFYSFAKVLNEHGLEWTYAHSRYFNHPPLTAYFLRGIFLLTEQPRCQEFGIHFPFLLRLPGIVADLFVVLILLQFRKMDIHLPSWALALFALSPVSLMVSGFHGNTDPIMVFFLVCAVWMCLRNQPALAGLFFALSCQIKIVPLLLLPAFILFWVSQERARPFLVSGGLTTAVLWSQPLLNFPLLFAKNVLAYGSYWGIWGITYLFRLTGLPQFSHISFFHLTTAQNLVVTALKLIVVTATICLAWRRRYARGRIFVHSLGYTWIIFFVFAPGVCAQYLIWLAPFILILSPEFYACLLVTSAIFLFAFYNSTAQGLPWMYADSISQRSSLWAAWSLLPWAALIAGSLLVLQKNAGADFALSSFKLVKFRTENA